MNGHFAAVGDAPSAQQYEHGVQVIDEDKQYKSVAPLPRVSPLLRTAATMTMQSY